MRGDFLKQRIFDCLGAKESDNKIKTRTEDTTILTNCDIFTSDSEDNIDILVWTLDRMVIQYQDPDGDPTVPGRHNEIIYTYRVKRLKNPKGDMKYVIPKKMGTLPFIPDRIIKKYEKKETIKTLVLTEGYIKAFKGSLHGIDVIGLASITTYKDKKTQRIHIDISRIITECKVENVIMLYDGDCANISEKALNNNEDLYSRPNTFYSSIVNIQQLLIDFNINLWFGTVVSSSHKDNPKGLDDILVSYKGAEKELADDLLQFSGPGQYFYKIRVANSKDLKKIANYLHIGSTTDFYATHEDVIGNRPFVFNGTAWQFQSKEGEHGKLHIVRRREADNYIRVGDNYYERISVPNKFGEPEQRLDARKKQTITDDFGKEIIGDIPKYKAFCNVPDHVNFQAIIDNCYNIYNPFKHVAEKGTIETTMMFLDHIFGEQIEIGLDYLQILYKDPRQILPILCLVSKENQTGKTKFTQWLKEIFEQNMAIVGNAELAEQFNAGYATKLLIACDETLIDRDLVINKIKSLSTNDKINIRAMHSNYAEIDFFGKFILLSNFEENFVKANEYDIRYWVRKIPVVSKIDVNLLDKLKDEIPAFLWFLDNRKMVYQNESRMYFNDKLLLTEALLRVKENSKSFVEKEINSYMRDYFLSVQADVIMLSVPNIKEMIFKGRQFETSYITRILESDLKLKRHKDGATCRYSVPSIVNSNEIKWSNMVGRPYIFEAEKFLNESELVLLRQGIIDETTNSEYDSKPLFKDKNEPPIMDEPEIDVEQREIPY